MLSSYFTSVVCDIQKGFITCSTTIITAYSFGFVLLVYSIVSLPILYIICVCVCVCLTKEKNKKKDRHSVLSSHPTSVTYDIEKGFITCSVILTMACSFSVGM